MTPDEFNRATDAILDTLTEAIDKLAKVKARLQVTEMPEQDYPQPEDFPPLEQHDQQREEPAPF